MTGKIPQYFIDDLLARADIVEVIDSRVKLRKSGKNYSACCPFHDEKTPSFSVSPDKQFYHCFGCGAGGNVVGFLMEYDRMSFPEAIEKLAAGLGLEVPREQLAPGQEQRQHQAQSLYQVSAAAADYFRHQLRENSAAANAVLYLKQRGLSTAVIEEFGIGVAPPGWDRLLSALGSAKAQQLELAGMVIRRDDKTQAAQQPGKRNYYDRFRNRIMFPIHDQRGRTIAFGGRALGSDKPKYLNSPETPIFHKGRELYGLWQALQANRDPERLILVEGYMDVVALAQFDIRCAVATLGTACGQEHIQLAFRHTRELVFCFDGDNAGRTAARKALEVALPQMQDGRSLRFLLLPEGEDPDTVVRQIGGGRFQLLIEEQSRPLEDFLFDLLGEGIDLQTMDGRARLSKLAAPMLNLLPGGVYRQLMFQQLARRTGLEQGRLEEIIHAELARQTQPLALQNSGKTRYSQEVKGDKAGIGADELPAQESPEVLPEWLSVPDQSVANVSVATRSSGGQYRMPAERMLIALLLHQPQLCGKIADSTRFHQSANADLQLFAQLVDLLKIRPEYNLNQLLGYWRAHHGADSCDRLAGLAASQLISGARALVQAKDNEAYNPECEFDDCLKRLNQVAQKQRNRVLLGQLQSGGELSSEQRALLANWQQRK
ncbi:MAG: DNA primase [Gammaproteobacteria bacterium]|nr:DNA primase [Gammaproteobacteria bacterium]